MPWLMLLPSKWCQVISSHDDDIDCKTERFLAYFNVTWTKWLPFCRWRMCVVVKQTQSNPIFKCIFVKENVCILMKISLKFVHSRPIDSKSSLVQVMARHWTCDKPILEPLMIMIYDAILHHMATVSYDVAFCLMCWIFSSQPRHPIICHLHLHASIN